MNDGIKIVGACINNLKSIDVVLPLRMATMVVGVSGSGKSSLLADTLATEANSRMRRFLSVDQPHLGDTDVPAFLGPLPPVHPFHSGCFSRVPEDYRRHFHWPPRPVATLFQPTLNAMGRRGQEHRAPAGAIELRAMDRTPLYRFVDRMDCS